MASSDVVEEKAEVLARLTRAVGIDHSVDTVLRTSDKVLARITDGIYREPQSAIRELIANAYDADAENVVVRTDPPRFDSITVEDDGNGMSFTTLASVLFSIGGSYKRSSAGAELNISSGIDSSLSPGGRKLIGKMGIGLFSVAQLTHSFQIITKVRGEDTRTVALVALRQYADSNIADEGPDEDIESGQVRIWREQAVDLDSHGTTIVLTSVRARARQILSSMDVWSAVHGSEIRDEDEELKGVEPPKYYIGYWNQADSTLLDRNGSSSNLPWAATDNPKDAFAKLVDSVWAEAYSGVSNPKLETLFDNYLRAVWQVALALPLPYFQVHPFDLSLSEPFHFYRLSSSTRGQPEKLPDTAGVTVGEHLGLVDSDPPSIPFRVIFDDLEISRPIRFRGLPASSHAIKEPMLFVGAVDEPFQDTDLNLSGGPLRFEAYLLWNPKIVPAEHRGVLVRIHGASGTLFDENFMHYQVAETTRLRQASIEVFVHEGLEGALNIDRESFNGANPHYVYLTKWVHAAIRQFTSTHKKEAALLHKEARTQSDDAVFEQLEDIRDAAWRRNSDDEGGSPPTIVFSDEPAEKFPLAEVDRVLGRVAVLGPTSGASAGQKRQTAITERQMNAIATILESYHVLDDLSREQQEEMLASIRAVLTVTDG